MKRSKPTPSSELVDMMDACIALARSNLSSTTKRLEQEREALRMRRDARNKGDPRKGEESMARGSRISEGVGPSKSLKPWE